MAPKASPPGENQPQISQLQTVLLPRKQTNVKIDQHPPGADGGQGKAGGPLLVPLGMEVSHDHSRWVWSGWSSSPSNPVRFLLGPHPLHRRATTSHSQGIPHLPAPTEGPSQLSEQVDRVPPVSWPSKGMGSG